MKVHGLIGATLLSAELLTQAGAAHAEGSWMGLEFGVLNIDSDYPAYGGDSKSGSTPVLRASGEVCSALLGTEGDLVQLFNSDSSASKPNAVSVFGLDCGLPFWEPEFAGIDFSVGAGVRYRYHSHFRLIHDTYASLPLIFTASKQVLPGLAPYATLAFGPIGYVTGDKYGKYNSLELGANYQFADDWKVSASYNLAHDESRDKGFDGSINVYDSTMAAVGIHYGW